MDLKTVAAYNSDTISCMSEIFNIQISSVLQLISRTGCHKLNHGKIAFPLLPDSLLVLLDVLHV